MRRDAAVVFAVALMVRMAFALETRGDPLFHILVIDARFHHDLASRFAAGNFGREAMWYAPLYPVALAALFKWFTTNPQVVAALQFLMGSITAGIGVVIGARFSPLAGRVAGGVLALSPVLVFYENQLLYASVAVFVTALFLLVLLPAAAGGGARGALGSGLVFGLLLMLRTNAILFAPVAVAVLFLRRGWRMAALFALGVGLALVPATLRNGLGAGAWTPLTVNGGMVFATGFAEESVGGRALERTPYDFGPGGAYHREAERRAGRSMTLAEASDWYKADTMARLREDPGLAVRLTWQKLRLLFTHRETDDNLSFPFVRKRAWTLRWAPAPWALLWMAAGAGLAVTFRKRGKAKREGLWLAAYAAVYGASLLLFFVNARYRLPMVVPAAVLAGVGASAVVASVRGRRWRELMAPAAGAAILAGPVLADPGVRSDPAYEWNAVGAALLDNGHAEDGLEFLDGAIARNPGMAGAHHNRALALMNLGRAEEAYAEAVEATRLDPDLAQGWMTQGALLARAGQVVEALPAFRRAAELKPDDAGAQRNLAQALAATGDLEGAITAGRNAVAAGDGGFAGQVAAWEAQQAKPSTP